MSRKIIGLLLFCLLAFGAKAIEKKLSGSKCSRVTKIVKQLKNPSDNYVLVAAHRGDWRKMPENSIPGIKNCVETGVDIVEIDVRMTKDSVLVLMHDATLDRTTTGSGKISEWTLKDLQALFLKDASGKITPYKIPTLKEAMLAAKGEILVNLDKCSGYMDLAYAVLTETSTVEQAVLKGWANVETVQKKYGNLLSQIIYMPIISSKVPDLEQHVNDFFEEYKPVAFEVLFTSDTSVMFEVIQNIKKEKSRIWVNTMWKSLCGSHTDDRAVADPNGAWGWVIKQGANIIQTDRPRLLLDYLREKGLHD